MGLKCPECKTDNTFDSQFCKKCATPLPSSGKMAITETIETPREELTTGYTFARRYQIIEELGKGGMGKVYKVLDKEVNAKIALKLIKPKIATDKKTIERFRNELKIARDISHKNVCRMYDLNKEGESYYITMEYVTGEDLKSFIKRAKRLDIRTAITIAEQVCEGLMEAHRLGVIHRDLKPSNIMIDKDGNARIMDFGIARSLREKGITGAGVMIGTPEYMSPEQAEGEEADQRSDLYSLGIILYEMLTGTVPFEGVTPLSIAIKHKTEKPRDPSTINAQIPEDVSKVILRCMEKDKDKRYQDAEQLLYDLGSIEKDITIRQRALSKEKLKKAKKIKIKWKKPTLLSGIFFLIVLFSWFGYKFLSRSNVTINSIAVLPFENVNENPELEYLSDGIAESLINKLSQVPGLTVISRFSVFGYKGKSPDLLRVGQELNVRAILTGRIVERSDGLAISVELVDAKQNSVLWGEQYNRKKITDIIIIQENISKEISEKLRLRLTGEEKKRLAKRYTGETEAYRSYLRGRFYWNKRTEEGMKKGLEYFEEAIEIDPGYALAYAGLADSYNVLARYSYLSPGEAMPKAIAGAMKAIEIDDMLGEAHASLAFAKRYYEFDWNTAETEYQKAIKFNPGYGTAHHWYSLHLSGLGNHAEAIAEIKRALELDPLSIIINTNVGWIYYFARQYDQAIDQFKKTLEMDPNFAVTHLRLGRAYVQKGRIEEAKQEFQEAINLSGGSTDMIAALGHAYALSGEKDKAGNILNQLINLTKEKYVSSYEFAVLYLGLGQKKLALDWLEKAYREHSSYIVYLKTDPRLDDLRSDPRFLELLKKMNLE